MESAMTPMVMFGFALMGLGGLIGGIFGILLMVEAFKVSAVWGLLYLFVPFASLVFVVQHWEQARKPF